MYKKLRLNKVFPRLWIKFSLVGFIVLFLVSCGGAASLDSAQSQISKNTPTPTVRGIAKTATVNPNFSIKTVFIIILENHDWVDVYKSSSAPYINKTLLPQSSYARQYYNPPKLHPSLPNYLWLEAGTNFGVMKDVSPADAPQSTQDHLVNLLENAGISWKVYAEGITGSDCPISDSGLYAARHIPMLYFNDVTDNNNPASGYCIQHIRPFSELATDITQGQVARFNFIMPNLCDDMHNNSGCATNDSVKNGDTWLSLNVPTILDSEAYKNGGALFITWDESEEGDNPIGMIVLSPFAKGGGYSNDVHYTHGSTLRTFQEIFGVEPFLGAAATSSDLSDLFRVFP